MNLNEAKQILERAGMKIRPTVLDDVKEIAEELGYITKFGDWFDEPAIYISTKNGAPFDKSKNSRQLTNILNTMRPRVVQQDADLNIKNAKKCSTIVVFKYTNAWG